MTCPACQQSNPAIAKFCMHCGYPLVDEPEGALFSPLSPNDLALASALQRPGERRVVTILFADLTGFTALSETMDPEALRNLMNGCFDHLVPIVEKYEGVVDKFIGDEIMALFGAPIAHEDDPARALHAALEMMEALQDFNAQQGSDLGLHIGINTGLVVTGGMGSQGRQQYSVLGDAVNLAARLESASTRGQIFLGPDTYRLAAPLFDFQSLEPMQVKGKQEPVQVYQLLGVKQSPERVRGLTGLDSPLVGRQRELDALLQLNETMAARKGKIVLLIGEAGLGKSRLMAEWRQAASFDPPEIESSDQRGFEWREGRCLSYGQGLAYHLLIDISRAFFGISASMPEVEARARVWSALQAKFGTEAADLYPYLAHLIGLQLDDVANERVSGLTPQALQNQYMMTIRQILERASESGPLGLIFEDIHWADPSSVELLLKLMPLVETLPILFCFVTRPDYEAPGWKLVTAAQESFTDHTLSLNLSSLPDHHSRELISNLLEIESLPEHIRNLILKRSEGNPFFVEEVIRMLIDSGGIIQKGNRWIACEKIDSVEIPDNLQGLLLARIDRLPDDIMHTLRVASVIGRQFSVRVLEDVLRTVQMETTS